MKKVDLNSTDTNTTNTNTTIDDEILSNNTNGADNTTSADEDKKDSAKTDL